ncbi:MAG: tetratricopeptide repeat protein [bacterium]|nr:tetratricopeptide repeat protein [bacterium]
MTTASADAQRWFDQGLTLCYGFNHAEAILSFGKAAAADPECAMAWWGIAYAWGPHINNPEMNEEAIEQSHAAMTTAMQKLPQASPLERMLIEALHHRYAWPSPPDRTPLNQAYAAVMREVWHANPDNADVGALFAESLMNLRPWDLWTPDGQMQPGTGELTETLASVLALEPKHPAALHFTIHTWEASPTPEKALPAADVLRDLVPWAGHLVHMPGHIDIRLGRYAEAATANQKAIAVDLAYVEKAGRGGFYTIYRAHNYHFLAYAAMFEGRREVALTAARDMAREVPLEVVRAFPDLLDGFHAVPYHVMVRFGLWKEMLDEPRPPTDLPVMQAMWRYGRTMALSSLGRVEESEREFSAFRDACGQVPESRTMGNNPTLAILDIGLSLAEGELEYRRGGHERAFELMRDAARRDDALRYDEPWGWMQPVRHALGALLLEQGQVAEAEKVYRADLSRHPGNGWALTGLAECLDRDGRQAEAEQVRAQFAKAWKRADTPVAASCFCRLDVAEAGSGQRR